MSDRGTLLLPFVLLLRPYVPAYELPRNQRKSGRRVTRLPAVMPRPASTLDQIDISVVASGLIADQYYGPRQMGPM